MTFFTFARNAALAVLILAGGLPARANIGDNISELRGRFGGAKDVGSGMLFQHDGYSICVYFDGSHAAMELFTRDGSKPDKTDITDKDVQDILAVEAVGQTWNPIDTAGGKQTWLLANGKMLARLSVDDKTGEKTLMIMVNGK